MSLVNMVVAYSVTIYPWNTYVSLVNMVVAYSVTVYPWIIYESLVNMVVAYSVMVRSVDDIAVIGQHGS